MLDYETHCCVVEANFQRSSRNYDRCTYVNPGVLRSRAAQRQSLFQAMQLNFINRPPTLTLLVALKRLCAVTA